MSGEGSQPPREKVPLNLGPVLSIAWGRVTAAMVVVGCAYMVGWGLLAPMGGWLGWPLALRVVPVVLAVALFGWLAGRPWRPRPAVDWVTVWLGGAVARMLLTPLACFGLYSVFPCDTAQFVAAAGGCCFAVVLAEVGMIATTLLGQPGPAAG